MLILASASPRRQELLRYITNDFKVVASNAREDVPAGTSPEETVEILAERKAAGVLESYPDGIVIGSDTVVALNGKIFGKPKDAADAKSILRQLSGRTHEVYTGVCLANRAGSHVFSCRTFVTFLRLSEADIEEYIATGEPFDKAGAYGIQGKGALLIEKIDGDFYNVMGLPVSRLNTELKILYKNG